MSQKTKNLEGVTGIIDHVVGLFIAWNAVFLGVAFFLRDHLTEDAKVSVFIRLGAFMLGGLVLLALNRGLKKHQRGSWIRLRIITTLAPIGIALFITFTKHLPIWFDISHVVSGLLIIYLALLINLGHMRDHFAKKA